MIRRRLLAAASGSPPIPPPPFGIVLPDHLRQTFITPTPPGRCMAITNPFWAYPIAVVGDSAIASQVSPLVSAIREAPQRPIRIITHADESGRVFNCSFFDDEETMNGFLDWYGENALHPDGPYHHCLQGAAADKAGLPTRETLIFGSGSRMLADTRFGEYQLGMAVRYCLWQCKSPEMREEAIAGAAALEPRVASLMEQQGIAYFGRLILTDTVDAGSPGTILSAVRYGSLEDARKGTAASRAMLATEVARWFEPNAPTIIGTAQRVLEV